MSVLFLSDHDDQILWSAYNYFSQYYQGCEYATSDNKINIINPAVIVTNYCVNHTKNKKIIYYATSPNGLTNEISNRRIMMAWLKECSDVVCSSMALAKNFYDIFRIKSTIQYPVICQQNPNQINIVYSNSFTGIDILRNELTWENFVSLNSPSDVATAKIYLQSSSSFLDLGLCVASTCGVPVVAEYNPNLNEFLESGDVLIMPNTSISQRIQSIKKTLKECVNVKIKSNKFLQMPVLEDKIKQALSKKPTVKPPPGIPIHKTVNGRKSGAQQRIQPNQPEKPPEPILPRISPPIESNTIYVNGAIVGISGYDNMVYEIIKGLKSINVDVRINSYSTINYNIVPNYFQSIHLVRPSDAWQIIITPPCGIDRMSPDKKSIIFTMWETDYLDPHWVKQANLAAFLIVPSEWAVESFKKCGVIVPIYKVPLGYDPLIFNPNSYYPTECVFGTAAALSSGGVRKNTKHIVDLFQRAFPNNDKVKLRIKITPGCPWEDCHDTRIEVIKNYLPPLELAQWYQSTVAFVNCSYAEGFGLHLIESMACGRPVISTKYSAVTEYFDENVGYVVDHKIIPVKSSNVPYSGHWGKPDDNGIITQMQHIYFNREEAKTKGEASFLRARNFTWKDTGRKLLNILTERGVIS